jgi:hypothetical protein
MFHLKTVKNSVKNHHKVENEKFCKKTVMKTTANSL